jgi:transposase
MTIRLTYLDTRRPLTKGFFRRCTDRGCGHVRKLLVVGAHAVLFHRKPHTDPLRMWAKKLIEKKPFKLVAVALANKMARIAFAILRGKTVYREIPA